MKTTQKATLQAVEWPKPYIPYATYAELEKEREMAANSDNWDEYHRLDEILEDCLVIPEVGIPGTVRYYTDSCSGYVQEMITQKKLVFKETGIYHSTITFSLRKNGKWVEVGQSVRDGVRLILGWAHDYRCEEI